jgi:hypothetical protein
VCAAMIRTGKVNTLNDVICNLDIIKARRLSHVVSPSPFA